MDSDFFRSLLADNRTPEQKKRDKICRIWSFGLVLLTICVILAFAGIGFYHMILVWSKAHG